MGWILVLAALPATASVGLERWRAASGRDAPAVAEEGYILVDAARRLAAQRPDLLWVDARAETDFMEDHIEGAVHLPLSAWDAGFAELLARWSPDVPVVVYCDSQACAASEKVAERLRAELGVDNVWALQGGWKTWRETEAEQ